MKIYLISGKARHGKDTIANYLKEYYKDQNKKACIMHIGNYIKHFAKDYFEWDGKEETKPRTLLQQLGTNVIREKMNKPYFFTNRLLEDMEVLEHFFDIFIIADVRLPLEIDEIVKKYSDTVLIRVKRYDFDDGMNEEQRMHVTETALDDYSSFKYYLDNLTLDKLKEDVYRLASEEEE